MSKRMKEIALWGIAYAFLLFLLLTPFAVFSLLLMMVPLIVLYVRQPPRTFAAVYIVVTVLPLLLVGRPGFIFIAISVYFWLAALAMGRMYKRAASAASALLAGALTLLAESLLIFLICRLFGVNLTEQFTSMLQVSAQPFLALEQGPQADDLLNQMIHLMGQMIPAFLIFFAIVVSVIAHALARVFLRRYGHRTPGLKPIKDWMLPRSMVWYYVIALVLDMFVSYNGDSLWSIILVNLLPLIVFAFAVQGVSFLFYISDAKGWGYALPVVGIIAAVFFSYVVSFIGLIDVAFRIRNRVKNS